MRLAVRRPGARVLGEQKIHSILTWGIRFCVGLGWGVMLLGPMSVPCVHARAQVQEETRKQAEKRAQEAAETPPKRSPLDGSSPLATPPNPLGPSPLSPSPLAASATSLYGVKVGEPQTVKYQIGARIQTGAGSFAGVTLRFPVPNEWPEQQVRILEEELYDRAGDVKYRVLDAGVRQMMVAIPQVPANTSANVLITYEIRVSPVMPPEQTAGLVKPAKVTKETKLFIGDSPQISARDRDLKKLVGELIPPETPAWDGLAIFHRWIMDNITETVSKPQSTSDTLENKQGCNEDRAALFVAMARAWDIPARMVMVEGGQHAEFCLADPEGNLHWYPCTFRGSGEFGAWSRPAVVFQKGDNIKEPEAKQRVRLIREYVNGKGTVPPSVQVIRRVVQ
jgi:hypothetical protein